MPLILIHTIILVYASDAADQARQDQALRVLSSLDASWDGRLSIQSPAEFVHVTTHSRRPIYTRS